MKTNVWLALLYKRVYACKNKRRGTQISLDLTHTKSSQYRWNIRTCVFLHSYILKFYYRFIPFVIFMFMSAQNFYFFGSSCCKPSNFFFGGEGKHWLVFLCFCSMFINIFEIFWLAFIWGLCYWLICFIL